MQTPPEDVRQPAESHADYRVARAAAAGGAKLTIAGLFFLAWYVVAYVVWGRPVSTGVFLLTTTALALIVSLAAAMISYTLFKRRGGRIVKGERGPPSTTERNPAGEVDVPQSQSTNMRT